MRPVRFKNFQEPAPERRVSEKHDTMNRRRTLLLGAAVLLSGPIESGAQQPPDAPILALAANDYVETFLPPQDMKSDRLRSPKPSARGIAGLHLGKGSGPFRLSDLRIRLAPNTGARDYCVRIMTGDGRYWSLNPYHRSPNKDAAPTVQTRSRLAAELASTYQAEEVMVRAVAVPKSACPEDASGTLVPIIPPGATSENTLAVYVNAPGDQAKVWLAGPDGRPLAHGQCTTKEETEAITYTERCEIPLTPQTRERATKLVLERIGSGEKSLAYDVQLPR